MAHADNKWENKWGARLKVPCQMPDDCLEDVIKKTVGLMESVDSTNLQKEGGAVCQVCTSVFKPVFLRRLFAEASVRIFYRIGVSICCVLHICVVEDAVFVFCSVCIFPSLLMQLLSCFA